MTSRGFAFLLCAFLAVPLCCCGWHGVSASAESEAEVACPLCQAAEPADAPEDDGCPCMKDVLQRDLAPRALNVEGPGWSLALLAENVDIRGSVSNWRHERRLTWRSNTLLTGPPRLYLKHHTWLC